MELIGWALIAVPAAFIVFGGIGWLLGLEDWDARFNAGLVYVLATWLSQWVGHKVYAGNTLMYLMIFAGVAASLVTITSRILAAIQRHHDRKLGIAPPRGPGMARRFWRALRREMGLSVPDKPL